MNKLILGAAIFSMATLANAQAVDATVTTTTDVAVAEDVTINASADKSDVASKPKHNCIADTGSHLKKARDRTGCNGEPGRSYDRADIESTGELTAGEALERLDVSVSIHH